LRFLVSYIAYSAFLNRMNLERVRDHYRDLLARCAPPVTGQANGPPKAAPAADA
jgi:hypothetical protein